MSDHSGRCEKRCYCSQKNHETALVVITGGPGAGKTALLEMAKKNFCSHVAVLPEAASLIFRGGFWRGNTKVARECAQRAIFHVQREMEELVLREGNWALGLCDRGTLDGLAYWPGSEEEFFAQVGSGKATELLRYRAVIHMLTPSAGMGYNHQNDLRTETAEEARIIDQRIEKIWSHFPGYVQVPSSDHFLAKAQTVLQLIEAQIPKCCQLPI